jgi:hypothetical protein
VVDKGWGVEDWLEMPCGPLPFVGKVDFYNKDLCVIGDWKTTGFKDFRYSKTPTALASHGQPLAYAYALFNDEPPASLSFQHINLLTKGRPDAMEVWAYEVPWSAVAANWETVKTTAVQMAAVAVNHQSADTVTPNQGACKKFGGCPHAEYCLASPKNRNLTTNLSKGEPTMGNNPGTNERLAALRATLGVSTDTPSPPPPTPPKKKTEEGDLASAVEKAGQVLNALGSVPEDVLKKIAQNAGVMAFQVMQELGLKLQDGSFVPDEAEPS